MVQEWFDKNIFLFIILGICGTGILIKFILSMKYRLLIRASKKMGTSKNKLMRVLRLKFETCYKLNIGVNNVDTFVDKYVYRYKFCGILLYTWETISGEIIILSVLSGSIFSVLGLLSECGIRDILSTFIAGVMGALVLISYDHFINLNMKRSVLKVNIRDYLENFLKSRLENGEFSSDLLEQYRKEYMELPQKGKKQKKKKEGKEKELPGLVAQVESAATVATPVKKSSERSQKGEALEFNDSQLFVNMEEKASNKPIEIKQAEEKRKEKHKKKLSPEKEAELRREAKKNELKRMIQEDKENRKNALSEMSQKETNQSNVIAIKKEEVHTVSPFSRPSSEVEASPKKEEVFSKKEEMSSNKVEVSPKKEEMPLEAKEEQKKAISVEEAKIIEDILREYLT